jgi:hypothetical protein
MSGFGVIVPGCDQLNSMLRGWSGYFGNGTRLQAYRAIDAHVYDRVRNFPVERHKVQGAAHDTSHVITCSGSVVCWPLSACILGHAVGPEIKRGGETERWSQ